MASLRDLVLNAKNRMTPDRLHHALQQIGNVHIASLTDAAYASQDRELFDVLLPYCISEFVCQITAFINGQHIGVYVARRNNEAQQELHAMVHHSRTDALQNARVSGMISFHGMTIKDFRHVFHFLRTNARLENYNNITLLFRASCLNVNVLQSFIAADHPNEVINNVIIRDGTFVAGGLVALLTYSTCSSLSYDCEDYRIMYPAGVLGLLYTQPIVRRNYLEIAKLLGPIDAERMAYFIKNNIEEGGSFAAYIMGEHDPDGFALRLHAHHEIQCHLSFMKAANGEWVWHQYN